MHSETPNSDFSESQFPRRRASDFQAQQAPQPEPTNAQIMAHLVEMKTILTNHIRDVNTAFPIDDIGRPDYNGHRLSHKNMIEAAKTIEGYKTDLTKKVLWWVVGGLAFVFFSGAGSTLKAWLLSIGATT